MTVCSMNRAHTITENRELLWCQLCHHWWHRRLSLWHKRGYHDNSRFSLMLGTLARCRQTDRQTVGRRDGVGHDNTIQTVSRKIVYDDWRKDCQNLAINLLLYLQWILNEFCLYFLWTRGRIHGISSLCCNRGKTAHPFRHGHVTQISNINHSARHERKNSSWRLFRRSFCLV